MQCRSRENGGSFFTWPWNINEIGIYFVSDKETRKWQQLCFVPRESPSELQKSIFNISVAVTEYLAWEEKLDKITDRVKESDDLAFK